MVMRHCIWFFLGILLIGADARAGRIEEIKARGELIVGVRDNVTPFGFVNEKTNQLEGFDVDVGRYIAGRLGVKYVIKPLAVSDRVPAVVQGIVDMAVAAFEQDHKAEENIDFSVPYFWDSIRLLVSVDNKIASLEELAAKKVATVKGTGIERVVREMQPACVPVAFDVYPAAFMALKRGEVVALAGESLNLLGVKRVDVEPDNWVLLADSIARVSYAIGLPENDSNFRDQVNKALMDMWTSGEFEKVYSRWFGSDADFPVPLDWEMQLWQ